MLSVTSLGADTQGRNASQEIDGAQPSSTPSLEEMFGTAAEAFRLAANEEWICGRMAGADTTCAWHVTDADFGLTALLDRKPIEVVEEAQDDAEIHICGSEEAWLPVFSGQKHMGIALAEGELDWSGPVRKFLGIFPIFRRAYVDVVLDRDPNEDTPQGSSGGDATAESASEGG